MIEYSVVISLMYIFLLMKSFLALKHEPNNDNSRNKYKVTVIIPFRNEESNILNSLKSIESQTYSKEFLEVIYIDDNSEDNSKSILQKNIKSDNIKIVQAESDKINIGFKKRAIEKGIMNACGDIIILTDADCIHDNDWITSMVKEFDDETGMVCGPVDYKTDNSIFQRLQKLEFRSLIIMGASLIKLSLPVIANAANIAFRKSLFYKVGGYGDEIKISSGDDDYLMHKIFYEENKTVKFNTSKESIVYTLPSNSLSEFINQRKRWASKSLYYDKIQIKFVIALLVVFYFSFLIIIIYSLFTMKFIPLIIITISKLVAEYILLKKGMNVIYKVKEIKHFLLAEVLHVPYIITSFLLGLKGNYVWKGRKIIR